MSDTGIRQGPVFLTEDDDCPKGLPLFVTRHTLRSLSLPKPLLEQLSGGVTTDKQPASQNQTTDAPSGWKR